MIAMKAFHQLDHGAAREDFVPNELRTPTHGAGLLSDPRPRRNRGNSGRHNVERGGAHRAAHRRCLRQRALHADPLGRVSRLDALAIPRAPERTAKTGRPSFTEATPPPTRPG